MEQKKHIVLLTPDGTGIKNYLYSNVFKNAGASLTLFHNFDEDTLTHIDHSIDIDTYESIPKYNESIREKFLRELIHTLRIRYNAKAVKNPTIYDFRNKKHNNLKLKLFYAAVGLSSLFYKSYDSILKLEKMYDRALRQNEFYDAIKKILGKLKPDLLFCTHQRALKAPTVFAVARDLGIETTTVIYSWDNLPKARLALKADTYLVWSQHMKREMNVFYPEISEEKIKITGTPQFEFFTDPSNVIPRGQFYKDHGLDPNKKIICFSGDDEKTSPYDPHYLNDLATGLSEVGMDRDYQIVFRRCPVDLSGRYDWVLQEFPDLIIDIPPLWNFNSKLWTAVYPLYEDIQLLTSLAKYCDVVINLGSTMAFDFGMFLKPCIYINYDHIPDKNWSVKTVYNYQHFRTMPSKKSVYWLHSKADVARIVKEAMEHPGTEIKSWFDVVVNHANSSSQKIRKELF